MKSKIALIAVLTLSLTACGPTPNYQQPQLPQLDQATGQPLPQAQQADDGIGVGTVAAAAIGGAVLGNMMGKSSANNQPQRTVIIDNRSRDYGYRNNGYSRGYGKQTVTTTTTKRSMFGGKTTTTRTVTKRRR